MAGARRDVVDELDFDIRLVEVKTLDPSAGYEPYLATYGFWTSRGFVHVGNPCAILIAAIDGTW